MHGEDFIVCKGSLSLEDFEIKSLMASNTEPRAQWTVIPWELCKHQGSLTQGLMKGTLEPTRKQKLEPKPALWNDGVTVNLHFFAQKWEGGDEAEHPWLRHWLKRPSSRFCLCV